MRGSSKNVQDIGALIDNDRLVLSRGAIYQMKIAPVRMLAQIRCQQRQQEQSGRKMSFRNDKDIAASRK